VNIHLHHHLPPAWYPCLRQVHNQTVVDVSNALAPTLERGATRQILAIIAILLTYTFTSAGVVYTIEVGARSCASLWRPRATHHVRMDGGAFLPRLASAYGY
jgi:hypothetical protein